MTFPRVVSRDEWRAERLKLLAKEKELTKLRDEVNAQRRELPMVRLAKNYTFTGPDGEKSLLELFDGRRQLIVFHYMLMPGDSYRCTGCGLAADNFGRLEHLHARDTSLVAISRAPIGEITPFKQRMGWTFPWYSSYHSDFNYDFHVTLDRTKAALEYNFMTAEELRSRGMTDSIEGEQPGRSVFLRDGEEIFHTYSSFARGGDLLLGTYNYLDLTPLGRQEDWERPARPGNVAKQSWVRLHDSY
jgi:predicted dithiol-disulfide oxidoreductase (DUF899 family)